MSRSPRGRLHLSRQPANAVRDWPSVPRARFARRNRSHGRTVHQLRWAACTPGSAAQASAHAQKELGLPVLSELSAEHSQFQLVSRRVLAGRLPEPAASGPHLERYLECEPHRLRGQPSLFGTLRRAKARPQTGAAGRAQHSAETKASAPLVHQAPGAGAAPILARIRNPDGTQNGEKNTTAASEWAG